MTTTDATSTTDTVTPELVVLLDEDGQAVGTADKAGVHHADTPLHLAFSCYLFDDAGNVLVTQRALHKRTFPGVWTNSCCGHPAPGEPLEDAVRRRVEQELGTTVTDLRLVLPRFRYRAEQDGVVENEMCPVFVGSASGTVSADPDEVGDARWEPWAAVPRRRARRQPRGVGVVPRAGRPAARRPAVGGGRGRPGPPARRAGRPQPALRLRRSAAPRSRV